MSWLWLNIPLAVLFFAATAGIPLWLVLTHPFWGAEPADIRHQPDADEPAQPRRADAPARQHASDSRPLADARR